jgi:hypothetical protein
VTGLWGGVADGSWASLVSCVLGCAVEDSYDVYDARASLVRTLFELQRRPGDAPRCRRRRPK